MGYSINCVMTSSLSGQSFISFRFNSLGRNNMEHRSDRTGSGGNRFLQIAEKSFIFFFCLLRFVRLTFLVMAKRHLDKMYNRFRHARTKYSVSYGLAGDKQLVSQSTTTWWVTINWS